MERRSKDYFTLFSTFPTKKGYHHFSSPSSLHPSTPSASARKLKSTPRVVSERKHKQISHHRKTQWGVASLEKESDWGVHSTAASLVVG